MWPCRLPNCPSPCRWLERCGTWHPGARPSGRSENRGRLAHHQVAVFGVLDLDPTNRDKVLKWADRVFEHPESAVFSEPSAGGMRTGVVGPPRPHSPRSGGPNVHRLACGGLQIGKKMSRHATQVRRYMAALADMGEGAYRLIRFDPWRLVEVTAQPQPRSCVRD